MSLHFSVEHAKRERRKNVYKKSLFSFSIEYKASSYGGNKKSWRCNILYNNNEAMCLLCCLLRLPCAASNGLLFVLGMLIKIKNHLGNKKSIVYCVCIHWKRYNINNSCFVVIMSTHNTFLFHTSRAASIHSI